MKKILSGLFVGFSPLSVLAADGTIYGLMDDFAAILSWALPVLISIAVLYFVWQVIQYTVSGDDDKRKEAKSGIIWGIIGLFVIVAVWGLVDLLASTLGVNTGGGVDIPVLPINYR